MKIVCIGSGIFSYAIATIFSSKEDNEVMIWTHDPKLLGSRELTFNKISYALPKNINITNDLSTVKDAKLILLMVSSDYLKETIDHLKEFNIKKTPLFIGSKGLLETEPYSCVTYAKKALKSSLIGFFAGPNPAMEMINPIPITMTIATQHKKAYLTFTKNLPTTVYTEIMKDTDVLEISSVLKNIYAIATGIASELFETESTTLSYVGACYEELNKLLYNEYDYENDSFYKGMVADFFYTTTSNRSRNFTFGRKLAHNRRQGINYLTKNTVEGYSSLEIIIAKLGKRKKNYKILSSLYDYIYKEGSLNDFIHLLN